MATVTVPFLNSLWIGDRNSNRARYYAAARRRLGLSPAHMVDYRELLAPRGTADPIADGPWSEIRIESPGKDPAVEALLAGRPEALEKGRLDQPCRWFERYRQWLRGLPQQLPYHNAPAEIELLFDKPRCHRYLQDRGLAVAAGLSHPDQAARSFLKLYCGSSCSGVVAYLRDSNSCFAPIERRGPGHYYNSRRVRRYQGAICSEILDWLLAQGAHLEEWLPKARLNGLPFDVRLVTIGGEPRHLVVRQGRAPMLGLQLGAQRGDPLALRAWLGRSGWDRLKNTARAVAAAFPGCLYLGIDLLIDPDRQPRVLEANAFGDLLPGILWRGQDTYSAELRCWSRRNSA